MRKRHWTEKTIKTHWNILLLEAILAAAAGCQNISRTRNAQSRWENNVSQMRIEAARQAMAEERYTYARRLLEPLTYSPNHNPQAQKLLAEIQAARQAIAHRKHHCKELDCP